MNELPEKLQIIRERLTKIEAYERKIWLFSTNILFILAITTKKGVNPIYLELAVVLFVLLMSKISLDVKRKKIQLLGDHLIYLPARWQEDLHLLTQKHGPTRFLLLLAFGGVYFVPYFWAYAAALFLYGLSFYAEAVYKNRNYKLINSLRLTAERPPLPKSLRE